MLLTLAKGSPKLVKSDKANRGYHSAILYLSPYRLSGHNVCPQASQGCAAACLNTAGRGRTNIVQVARLKRTRLFFDEREIFITRLHEDIEFFIRRCKRRGVKPAIRLNGTSDLQWERLFPSLFSDYSTVQFYDYTKIYRRMVEFCDGKLPPNYHLTFSRSETNHDRAIDVLSRGGNVAIVFDRKELPSRICGFPVFNGDETDLRFLDPFGVVGLYAKGKARRDTSGFVVPTFDRNGKSYVNYRKLA